MLVISTLIAYLIGGIPSGVLLARFFKLQDPRSYGSGNIGASNLTRLGGARIGALTLLFDFCKGLIPTLFGLFYFQDIIWAAPLIGFATVLGHCYSPFLHFEGGKGVATGTGVLFPLAWIPMLFGLAIWIFIFSLQRITSFAAFIALLTIIFVAVLTDAKLPVLLLMIAVCLLILRRHEKNLEDLLEEKERRF